MAQSNIARVENTDGTPAANSTTTSKSASFPNFVKHFNDPERKWQVEVLQKTSALLQLEANWDSYSAPPVRRDAAMFAMEILVHMMGPRTPIPQVVPSSVGGLQLEWHAKGVDLEVHIAAPYEVEMWFQDHQSDEPPQSIELSNDFSALKRPIEVLTTR